jgi:hypothetical protein
MTDLDCALKALSARHISGALDFLHRAESSGHDPDECAGYRWLCLMLAGRFEEAWRESDRIAARGGPDPYRLWDGQPFTGKRVLIRCLHGYGDAIQFIRYARLLRRDAARVIVQTHPQLVSLFRGVPYADDVITWPDDPLDDARQWDQQIEVMELPRAFRTTLETIPREVPYLFVRGVRSRIPPRPGNKPRIGLQWGSSDWDHTRSLRLDDLSPILDNADFEFYSFQRGPQRGELTPLQPPGSIVDVSGDSPEIVEAAADLMNIDLLITVDTMLAHLAGALARPVWVLLPYAADWRWMLDRHDSPWYPTMRLFRQPSPGAWQCPIREIAAALRKRNIL